MIHFNYATDKMIPTIIDGKLLASNILENVKTKLSNTLNKPMVVIVVVGNHPASQTYIKNKIKTLNSIDIETRLYQLSEDVTEDNIKILIGSLNYDITITSILVQLPLPKHIDTTNWR